MLKADLCRNFDKKWNKIKTFNETDEEKTCTMTIKRNEKKFQSKSFSLNLLWSRTEIHRISTKVKADKRDPNLHLYHIFCTVSSVLYRLYRIFNKLSVLSKFTSSIGGLVAQETRRLFPVWYWNPERQSWYPSDIFIFNKYEDFKKCISSGFSRFLWVLCFHSGSLVFSGVSNLLSVF